MGIFSAELGFAWGIGPWVTGLYYDAVGDYRGVFLLYLGLATVVAALALLMPRSGKREARVEILEGNS